ncbi:MAG: cytochrome P450 [Desertimonas sp.]
MSSDTITRGDGVVTCPFDHHSADFSQNFRDIYDDVRSAAPLVWSDAHGGYWIATTFEMVRRLARDSEGFTVSRSEERVGGILIPAPPGAETRPRFVPGEADGEEHDAYRLALNPHFSRARIAELQPMIERHVTQAFDRVVSMGDFDVAYDLVAPILSGIACEIMGLEVEDPAPFFDSLMHMVDHGSDGADDVMSDFDRSWAYIVEVVNERRAEPRDDVVTALVQYEPKFTDEQIHMMILNVSLGANDTTKSLLAQALIYLDEHPDVRHHLAAHPDAIRPAVDEFLRLLPVAMGPCRTATRDMDIDGVKIKKNDRLMLAFPSANHDPAKYANPRQFDLDRGSAQHLGMGVGSHFCLGAWLAKAISATTIRQLLTRCPNFSVDTDDVEIGSNRSSLTALERTPAHVGQGAA